MGAGVARHCTRSMHPQHRSCMNISIDHAHLKPSSCSCFACGMHQTSASTVAEAYLLEVINGQR